MFGYRGRIAPISPGKRHQGQMSAIEAELATKFADRGRICSICVDIQRCARNCSTPGRLPVLGPPGSNQQRRRSLDVAFLDQIGPNWPDLMRIVQNVRRCSDIDGVCPELPGIEDRDRGPGSNNCSNVIELPRIARSRAELSRIARNCPA